jgi:HD-like signal output (HDOD) protein
MKLLLENATSLPSIPKVIQELIASLSDEHASNEKIAAIISNDQAIAAKVLRLANSARYGGQRKIGSIKDALLVLGSDTLRTLVLSVGLASSFTAPATFDLKAYWQRSFRMANHCKWLAKLLPVEPEVAYTCGLLHGIGEYLLHVIKPEVAVEIDNLVAAGASRRKTEQEKLGFDYTMAGSELADYWKFPPDIVNAIRWQQQPAGSGSISNYAALILLARYMLDHSAKIAEGNFDDFPVKLVHALHISLAAAYERMATLPAQDEDLSLLLS